MKTKSRYLINDFSSYVGRIITFTVDVAHSGKDEEVQNPLLLLREIKETGDGHFVLVGVNLKRIEDLKTMDQKTAPFRSFRVDRIQFGSLKVVV